MTVKIILLELLDWIAEMEDQVSDIGSQADFEYESPVDSDRWVELKKMAKALK